MDITLADGFFDLCVDPPCDENNLYFVLSRLNKMGYKTVAINQSLEESVFQTQKKKKKKQEEVEAPQNLVPEPYNTRKLTADFKGKLRVLTRLTFICSDPAKTHMLAHSQNLKKYDIYAIVPQTQAVLQFACSQLGVDLITIRPQAVGLKLNRKLYQQAIERGAYFEIQYSDILEVNARKGIIHNSHLFHTYGKSKNVIMSSGANSATSIRSPYDVVNLAMLLGLSEYKSKACILYQCKQLLLRAGKFENFKSLHVEFFQQSWWTKHFSKYYSSFTCFHSMRCVHLLNIHVNPQSLSIISIDHIFIAHTVSLEAYLHP